MQKLNWSAFAPRLVLLVAAGLVATVGGPQIPAAAETSVESIRPMEERAPVPVPEPGGFALFGTGLLALAVVLRWKFNHSEVRKPVSQSQSWLNQKPEEMWRGAAKPPQSVPNANPEAERSQSANKSAKGTAA